MTVISVHIVRVGSATDEVVLEVAICKCQIKIAT